MMNSNLTKSLINLNEQNPRKYCEWYEERNQLKRTKIKEYEKKV